jgi:protein gp138
MINDIIEALQLIIESSLSDVNTSLPGKIISYDAARNRAIVAPSLPKSLSSDDILDPPKIVEVPVVWPASGGGKASLTFPLQSSDGLMLSFQQRSLEGWLDGNNQAPNDPRQHDLSDCVAHPGLSPSGISAHPTDVVLKFDKTFLQLTHDGQVIIGNDKANITIDASGHMTLNAQTIQINTPARNFTLETHRHTNVQSGIATSGTPI